MGITEHVTIFHTPNSTCEINSSQDINKKAVVRNKPTDSLFLSEQDPVTKFQRKPTDHLLIAGTRTQ